jgi:hypothetical protein
MEKKDFYKDFPSLNETISQEQFYHRYFQETLVFLYFQLFRKTNIHDLIVLSDYLNNVLFLLKKLMKKSPETWNVYLKYYYSLMIHTRDFKNGKGEHDVTYMMIVIWYKHFPVLSIFFIHQLVSETLKIGCWRDMKYLCQYVKETSMNEKLNNSIYEICIRLMNNQLEKDLIHYSNNEFHRISNVSKWIPRENKKFDWFYTKLVMEWSIKYFPYLMNSDKNNFCSIISSNQSKKKYRQVVSSLNIIIKTTQVKMCENNYKDISTKDVSKITIMKNPCLFYNNKYTKLENIDPIKTNDREQCYMNFKTFFLEENRELETDKGETKNSSTKLPVSYFIKEGFELMNETKNALNNEINQDIQYRIELLNMKWNEFVRNANHNTSDYIIPFLDVSHSIQYTDSESYYTAIGLAFLLCETSKMGKRIMICDNLPLWINLQGTNNLFEMILYYDDMTTSLRSSFFNIEKAIDVLVYSLQKTEINFYSINHLKIVILSDFSEYKIKEKDDLLEFGVNNETNNERLYDKIKKRFTVKYTENKIRNMPQFIFWNLSKSGLIHLPCSIYKEKTILLSGFQPLIYDLIHYKDYNNPYDMIAHILSNKKYSLFHNYIDKLLLECS